MIETHPGGGLYNCLSLYERGPSPSGRHLDFNREGRLHWHEGTRLLSWDDFWWDAIRAQDTKSFVERIEAWAGIPAPSALPPTNAEVLTYRVIAALLTTTCFGLAAWRCVNGFGDTSGMGGGPRTSDFNLFPHIDAALVRRKSSDLLGIPKYRFWFVRRDSETVLAFEISTGTCWDRGGRTIDLVRLYAQSKRIHLVLLEAAGHILS